MTDIIVAGVEEEYRAALGADEGFLGRSSFSWIRGWDSRGV